VSPVLCRLAALNNGIHAEVEGYPLFPNALSGATVRVPEPNTGCRSICGGIMIAEMLSPLAKPLTSWLHAGHRSVAAVDDCDGACPACDHPFGELNHMCFGGPSTVASDRVV
jgi:hypothetical protein